MKRLFFVTLTLSLLVPAAIASLPTTQVGQVDYYKVGDGQIAKGYAIGDQYYYEDPSGDVLKCTKTRSVYLCN